MGAARHKQIWIAAFVAIVLLTMLYSLNRHTSALDVRMPIGAAAVLNTTKTAEILIDPLDAAENARLATQNVLRAQRESQVLVDKSAKLPESTEFSRFLHDIFAKHMSNNTVTIVPCNSDYVRLLKILLCTISKSADPGFARNLVVQALDAKVEGELAKFKDKPFGVIPYRDSFKGTEAYAPGSAAFYEMMGARGTFLTACVLTGVDLIFMDVDAVVITPIRPHLFARFESGMADISVSTDARNLSNYQQDPFEGQRNTPPICFGFLYIRSNIRTYKLMGELQDILATGKMNDQQALNEILNKEKYPVKIVGRVPDGYISSVTGDKTSKIKHLVLDRVDRATDTSTISLRILDQREFTNAFVYQWSHTTFFEFERVYRDRLVLLHGNFGGFWDTKHDWYQRHWWDKILTREQECKRSFLDRWNAREHF